MLTDHAGQNQGLAFGGRAQVPGLTLTDIGISEWAGTHSSTSGSS